MIQIIKLAFLTCIILFGLSFAAQSQSQNDSLDHYMIQAIKNNPLVLQNYYLYLAALQKVPQAGTLQDPQVSAGILLKPMELPMGKQIAEIQLMQMFPWFGTLPAARDEMSQMAKAQYQTYIGSTQELIYDMCKTWNELYKTQKLIEISERNIEILRTIERLSVIRFKTSPVNSGGTQSNSSTSSSNSDAGSENVSERMSGMNNGNLNRNNPINQFNASTMQSTPMEGSTGSFGLVDLYRIQIEISDLNNNIALLKNQELVIQARFNSFLNRPSESPVVLPDTMQADTFILDIPSLRDSMLKDNPMVNMLSFEKLSLEARKRMVTRMGYPMIGLGLSYTIMGKTQMAESGKNGKDMVMPMMSVSLPVYRKKYKSMQMEADILTASNVQNSINTANNLEVEFFQAEELYKDAGRRVKLFTQQKMLASKSLDILLKSFSTSGSSLTDILKVRQQVLDYDFKIIEAITDVNSSAAWLKRLSGITEYKK